jgi:iron complex outermembrane receptor protein
VRDFLPLSAAVGALYDLNDAIKLGLTASTAARAPAQTELFARGPHDGPQTFETGDPALKMERSNSLEGTLRAKYDVIDFEGSLWSSWFNHFIYGALTGRMCNDAGDCLPSSGGDLKELLYRQQGAHYWGAEAKAAIPLWKPEAGQLDANLQGDFVRATLSDGGNVPRIPPYRIGGGLSWTSDAFDAGFLFLFAGRQDEFGQFDTPTPSYVALDAHVAWRPFTNSPGVEFLLAGHNLTNAVQRNAAAMNKDDVVLPGRDVRFVMRLATN